MFDVATLAKAWKFIRETGIPAVWQRQLQTPRFTERQSGTVRLGRAADEVFKLVVELPPREDDTNPGASRIVQQVRAHVLGVGND